MKCPKCGSNHKRKSGMRCNCGYNFVLDPKQAPFVSDKLFQSLIQNASAMDTRYFTLESLYGVMKRKFRPKPSVLHIYLGLIIGIIALVYANYFVVAAAVAYIIFIFARINLSKSMSLTSLKSCMDKWQKSELKSAFYLKKPDLVQAPPDYAEQDIYDYGVEKIILVDKDLTVDYLVKNKEHVNAKALVMSISGYPNYLQNVMKKVVAEQNDVPILLFHSITRNQQYMLSSFEKNTSISLPSENVHDMVINKEQLKTKKLVRGFDSKDLQRLSIDMLPIAAVSMIGAMGLEALAQYSRYGGSAVDGGLDFG